MHRMTFIERANYINLLDPISCQSKSSKYTALIIKFINTSYLVSFVAI